MDNCPNHLIKNATITRYVMPAILIQNSGVIIMAIRYNVPLIISKNQGWLSFQSNS
jgi:hypothetical protein